MNRADADQLVEAELARMPEAARQAVRSRITEPRPERRTWSYGPGEFECWCVGTDATGELTIVYQGSPGAFGDRWGCVETQSRDLGSDDRWFVSLYAAAIAADWLAAPAGYEID